MTNVQFFLCIFSPLGVEPAVSDENCGKFG